MNILTVQLHVAAVVFVCMGGYSICRGWQLVGRDAAKAVRYAVTGNLFAVIAVFIKLMSMECL